MPGPVVFPTRPTKAQALGEVERFFGLLQRGDAQSAGQCLACSSDDDWWPHQVRSLWQDLVVPFKEEQGEDADLDDDVSWRDLSWLEKIGVDLATTWDGKEDDFYVNVLYDGVVTDVSAEFSVASRDDGWVVKRDTLHVA